MAESTSTCNPSRERETLLFTGRSGRHAVLTVADRGAGSVKMAETGAQRAFRMLDYA
jgi:hypothetical protein